MTAEERAGKITKKLMVPKTFEAEYITLITQALKSYAAEEVEKHDKCGYSSGLAEGRNQALDEAVKVAKKHPCNDHWTSCRCNENIAQAIDELKETP